MMLAVRLIVWGRVQGVGFRYAAVARGRRLGLDGWARNLPDGSVEVVAAGPDEALEQLARWCASGPPSARVTRVDRSEAGTLPPPGFAVRY